MRFIEKLVPGNRVWLVKENKEAIVYRRFLFSYVRFGTIGLNIDGNNVIWKIDVDGCGFDKAILLRPIDVMSDEAYLNYFTSKYKIDYYNLNKIAESCKNYEDVFYLIRKWIAEENCYSATGCNYEVIDF